jgi:hypothetical protein
MVRIILDTREAQENEFFFSYSAGLNEDNLRNLFAYINTISNIDIKWINRSETVGNQYSTAIGIRVIQKDDELTREDF